MPPDGLLGMDIPMEIALGRPRAVLVGSERLLIEQHRGVYSLSQKEIVVKTSCGLLEISGDKLSLLYYRRDDLMVLGDIKRLGYR